MRQILWMWNSNLIFSHTHGGEVRERNELIPKQIYRDSPCSSSEIRNLFIHTFWDDIEFNWISKWVYSNANNFRYANDSYYFGHNSNCLLLCAHTLSHSVSFRSVIYVFPYYIQLPVYISYHIWISMKICSKIISMKNYGNEHVIHRLRVHTVSTYVKWFVVKLIGNSVAQHDAVVGVHNLLAWNLFFSLFNWIIPLLTGITMKWDDF